MPKLNTAALALPVLVTVGVLPYDNPTAVPAAIVAAVPAGPVAPVMPDGIVKLNIAF